MPFKTFAPGVLTSSDVNTFLMQQAVITCTSTTRPTSPTTGMTIYETDTALYRTWSGSAWEFGFKSGAWITYTPVLSFFGAGTDWVLGNAVTNGAYQRVGRMIVGRLQIVWGSTSVYGTKSLIVSQPVNSASTSASNAAIGVVLLRDVSSGNGFPGTMEQTGGNGMAFGIDTHNNAFNQDTVAGVTSTSPFTWANGDTITITFWYEAAA
jgi:hypothetical protein